MRASAEAHRLKADAIASSANEHLWRWSSSADGFAPRCGWYGGYDVKQRRRVPARTYQMAWPIWEALYPTIGVRDAALTEVLAEDMMTLHGVRSASSTDERYTLEDVIVPYSNWRGPM
jgi:hypothetical protein